MPLATGIPNPPANAPTTLIASPCKLSRREATGDIMERYYTVNLRGSGRLWPKNGRGEHTVFWCLGTGPNRNEYDKQNFGLWLEEAFGMWGAGGHGPINIMQQDLGWCDDVQHHKPYALMVTWSTSLLGSSTIGYSPCGRRNLMTIGFNLQRVDDTKWMIMHELGHIFGFDHEHQRPQAWDMRQKLSLRLAPKPGAKGWEGFMEVDQAGRTTMSKIPPELRARMGFNANDQTATWDYSRLMTDWAYAFKAKCFTWSMLPKPSQQVVDQTQEACGIAPDNLGELSQTRDIDWKSV